MNERLLRLSEIIGSKKRGIEPILPISRSAWYLGIKSGKFPKPLRLGERTAAWRESDIQKIVEKGI